MPMIPLPPGRDLPSCLHPLMPCSFHPFPIPPTLTSNSMRTCLLSGGGVCGQASTWEAGVASLPAGLQCVSAEAA